MDIHTKRTVLITLICILILVGFAILAFLLMWDDLDPVFAPLRETETEMQTAETQTPLTEAAMTEPVMTEPETTAETEDPMVRKVQSVYTFLQGPKAWGSKAPWSGEWCEFELEGGLFSVFGCGLCDMANVYSTLTPYECSPIDMYRYAMEASDYSPDWGYGAIDWPYMKQTLQSTGFRVTLRRKDRSYNVFRNAVEKAMTAIVLVSSQSDDTYWQDTPGHYVNIWLYDPETDEVLLADSGDPSHNRSWIPLRTVYDALAYDSAYQYMTVHSYDEEKNTWKYSGISEKWTIPDYYIPKDKKAAG